MYLINKNMTTEIEKKPYMFIADAMLGKIARKLRLFGFDTFYKSDIDDIEVISISKNEKRIILTGDRNLFAKSNKLGLTAVLINCVNEIDNLVKILSYLGIKYINYSPFSTRCTVCNNELNTIHEKKIIKEKHIVPPYIVNTNDVFFLCSKCDKIYWNGSHIQYMSNYIDEINIKLCNLPK